MHVRTVLQQLGYSPNEVAVYLATLGLGGSTATDIAAKSKLPRTTVNLVLDGLHKKGLVSAYLQHRRKIWAAESPEKLLIRIKENEAALKIVLPELHSLRHEAGVKPTVRTYSGIAEIKQIMNDIIESKHHISAIVSWDDWIALMGRDYMDDFIETRYRRYLKIRLLSPRTKTAAVLRQKDNQELRTTRFLPDDVVIANSNFIYANKVAIISLNKRQPVGILIEDEDIHHTMEVLFESLWLQSGGQL